MMDEVTEILPTDWKPENSMIKVIGVGGGGCNAVTYMYNQKIQGCSFIVCNTDSQALEKSNVPIKIPLGDGLETIWHRISFHLSMEHSISATGRRWRRP